MEASSQEAPSTPTPTTKAQQQQRGTLWDSVEYFGPDRLNHPILYEALNLVRRKLNNGMARMYRKCDADDSEDHLGDMLSLGGTFGLLNQLSDEELQEQLNLPPDQQGDEMAFAITDERGIRFNYDLVMASTTCAQQFVENWGDRLDDAHYTSYLVFLEVLCEHELAHAKNHADRLGDGFTGRDINPDNQPLCGESGYTIQQLLQMHRKKTTSERAQQDLVTVEAETAMRNRYRNLRLRYGLVDGKRMVLNGRRLEQLNIHEMFTHVNYFKEPEKQKKKRGRKRRIHGGGGKGGDPGKDGGGSQGGGGKSGHNGGDGGNHAKKPGGSGVNSESGAHLAIGGGVFAASSSKGDPSQSDSEESTSSSEDSDSDGTHSSSEDEDIKKMEGKFGLKSKTVEVGGKNFTKYTVDCDKLEFVSKEGQKLNVTELAEESSGILDREALLALDGEERSDKIMDGIGASIEECSVNASFCDRNWVNRKSNKFRAHEDIYMKLQFTNETDSVVVASVTRGQFGRGPINVEIKDYQHYCNRSSGLGMNIPIAPGKSYTQRRGLTKKSKEDCMKHFIRFVTPKKQKKKHCEDHPWVCPDGKKVYI